MIDGSIGKARYINHGCKPNLIAKVINYCKGNPQLIYIAKEDIAPDTELEVNYNIVYKSKKFIKKCHCS